MAGSLISGGLSLAGSLLGANSSSKAINNAADQSAAATRYAADLQKGAFDDTVQLNSPNRTAGLAAQNMLMQYLGLQQPGFNEYSYLLSNPDVAAAVAAGDFTTGAEHYQKYGRNENRLGVNPNYSKSAGYGSLMTPFSASDMYDDPGYSFRMNEGMKAMDRSAAARGGLQSGAALKAAQRYGQDYASGEYQNSFNRYNENQKNQFNRLASMMGLQQTATNNIGSAGSNYANNVGNLTMNNADNQAGAAIARGNLSSSMYGGIANSLAGIAGGIGGSGWSNIGNMLGGNFGASGSWINPDTNSLFMYR